MNQQVTGKLPLIFCVDHFLDIFATSVGTRAVFILDKMSLRRRPTNEVPIEVVYDSDHMTRLEQQMEALTQ